MGGGIHPPLSVIESWPIPNYVDPPTQGWGLVILCAVFGALSIITVSLRLYIRAWVQRSMGIDDWLMLAAMFPTIGMTVGICLESKVFYFDRHVWDVPPTAFVSQRKVTFSQYFLYVVSTGLVKTSILFFYRRMTVAGFKKWFIYTVWASIIYVIAYMIGFVVSLIFNCSPVDAFWNQLDPEWVANNSYSCIPEAAGLIAASSVSLSQDLLVAILPTILFTQMEIPVKQKIVLGAIFAVGFFLCITAALRIYYIWRVFYVTYDVTWEAYDIWAWTAVEVLCATIIASLPALKVFVRQWLDVPSWMDSFRRRYSSHGGRSWKRTGSSRGDIEDPSSPEDWPSPTAKSGATPTWPSAVPASRGRAAASDSIERQRLRSRPLDVATESDSPTLGPSSRGRDMEMGYLSSSSQGAGGAVGGYMKTPTAQLPPRAASAQSHVVRVVRDGQLVELRGSPSWDADDPIVNTGNAQKAGRILGL